MAAPMPKAAVLPAPPSQRSCRHEFNMIMNQADYNLLSMVIHSLLMGLILASVAMMMLETVAEYEHALPWGRLNTIAYEIFTVEYFLRLLLHEGSRLAFVTETMNVIDLLAISPFLFEEVINIEMILEGLAAPGANPGLATQSLRLLRIARLFRLVRLLKLAKYSSDLQVVAECLYRSRAALYTLCFMMGLSVIIFSSLMFEAEKGTWDEQAQARVRSDGEPSPYLSIPGTCWWAIVTMTTVGYGDVFPVEPLGKLIAVVAMISGILVIALPITIIGANYAECHAEAADAAKHAAVPPAGKTATLAGLATQLEDQLAALDSSMAEVAALFADAAAAPHNGSAPAASVVKAQLEVQGLVIKSGLDAYCKVLRLAAVDDTLST